MTPVSSAGNIFTGIGRDRRRERWEKSGNKVGKRKKKDPHTKETREEEKESGQSPGSRGSTPAGSQETKSERFAGSKPPLKNTAG